jgi:hypothetical protein
MPAEAQARLADQQAQLVSALQGAGAAPAGFDERSLYATAASLAAKRRRSVARAWPALSEALGDRFDERFQSFAAISPLPSAGGPLADGRAFARWLAAAGELPDAGRLQALHVDLHFAQTAHGLRLRRGPALKAALLSNPRRLLIALRLPWLGERWLCLPLGWLSLHEKKEASHR